jgi:hypothetical protein
VLFIDNNETTDTRVKFYCLFHEVNLEIFSLINAPLLEKSTPPGRLLEEIRSHQSILNVPLNTVQNETWHVPEFSVNC